MDFQIDMRVAELLAARLCHDLVGPIGAVNNGLELMEDDDLGMSDEALQLAAKSGRRAASVLQFYRIAFGMAGARIGADPGDLRDLAAGYLASSKAELDWTVQQVPADAPEGLGKLLLNMIVLAEEALPRGGTLTVSVLEGPEGLETSVAAHGPGARLREENQPVLVDDVALDELTPRNVQGYFTRLLAQRMGSDLLVEYPGADNLRLSAALKN